MRKALFLILAIALSMGVMAQQKIQLRSVDKAECVKSDMTSLEASFSFSTIEAQDYESERGTFSWLSLRFPLSTNLLQCLSVPRRASKSQATVALTTVSKTSASIPWYRANSQCAKTSTLKMCLLS